MMQIHSESDQKKVVVNFQLVGSVPKLCQSKFKICGNEMFLKVIEFLRRQIHHDTVNFGIDGQLMVNYASSMAWGLKVHLLEETSTNMEKPLAYKIKFSAHS